MQCVNRSIYENH